MTRTRIALLPFFALLFSLFLIGLSASPVGAAAEEPSAGSTDIAQAPTPDSDLEVLDDTVLDDTVLDDTVLDDTAQGPPCARRGQGRAGCGGDCGGCGGCGDCGGCGGKGEARGRGRGQGQGCCQGQGGGQGQGTGQGRGRGQGCGQGGRQRGPDRPEVAKARSLLDLREGIQRRVEQIPGGVRTTTTAEDPATRELLRSHVRDMERLIREGGNIRMWDPLYAELLSHRELIEMTVRDIEGGVEVIETSADPWVTELIRAQASKVVEYVYRGWDAYREPTALPERPVTGESTAGGATP